MQDEFCIFSCSNVCYSLHLFMASIGFKFKPWLHLESDHAMAYLNGGICWFLSEQLQLMAEFLTELMYSQVPSTLPKDKKDLVASIQGLVRSCSIEEGMIANMKGIYSAKERVTPEEISNPSYEGNVSCHDKAEPGYLLEAS